MAKRCKQRPTILPRRSPEVSPPPSPPPQPPQVVMNPVRLPPGFRFTPTDEELVVYYLRHKVRGTPCPYLLQPIPEANILETEPWFLYQKNVMATGELEWYFFNPVDMRYANTSRPNRETNDGYWKATNRDTLIQHMSRDVGVKKTLIYYIGQAPDGERTNWEMHEYSLMDEELQNAGVAPENAFMLCKVFFKNDGDGIGEGNANGDNNEQIEDIILNQEEEMNKAIEVAPEGNVKRERREDNEAFLDTMCKGKKVKATDNDEDGNTNVGPSDKMANCLDSSSSPEMTFPPGYLKLITELHEKFFKVPAGKNEEINSNDEEKINSKD